MNSFAMQNLFDWSLINTLPQLQFGNSLESPVTVISAILSFVSLFNGASGIFKYVQFHDREDQMPKYAWKRKFVTFLFFLDDNWSTTFDIVLFLWILRSHVWHLWFFNILDNLLHCIFNTYCFDVSKTQIKNRLWKILAKSLFSPNQPLYYILIHPRSNTFLWSSVASALAHLALSTYASSDLEFICRKTTKVKKYLINKPE